MNSYAMGRGRPVSIFMDKEQGNLDIILFFVREGGH